MLNQAIYSIAIGGGIAIVGFIPILIWQYRRYGDFQPARMLWLSAGFIYLTALIAYTLFPLPDMSGDYCATHPQVVVFDPTLYFREMAERLAGMPLQQALLSWDVLQMAFNLLLFVPLGVFLSDFFVIKFRSGIFIGLGVSLLIEATQYTANWGIMRCAYRVADVNDLITNTTGTAVGYLLALLLPRFVARPAYLRKRRNMVRPITRARRWTSMLLDLTAWLVVWGFGFTVFAIGFSFAVRDQTTDLTEFQQTLLMWSVPSIGVLAGLLSVVWPALTPHGASLGQRIVFLRPVAPRRWRLLARALVVQGVGVASLAMPIIIAIPTLIWVLAAVASIFWTKRGLSCVLTGCHFVDARSLPAETERPESVMAESPA